MELLSTTFFISIFQVLIATPLLSIWRKAWMKAEIKIIFGPATISQNRAGARKRLDGYF